jgi:glutaredoxin-related protein
MSAILYYSNHCTHSKSLLQQLAKTKTNEDIHFVCIDKRRREKAKTYIILENGQELVLPENVTAVPALLLLSTFSVVFGEDIYKHLRPKEEIVNRVATQNNMEPNAFLEPMAFSLSNSFNPFGIVSDQYSFVEMDPEEMKAEGNGGTSQMHHYLPLDFNQSINAPKEYDELKNTKMGDDMTIEKIQQRREKDLGR